LRIHDRWSAARPALAACGSLMGMLTGDLRSGLLRAGWSPRWWRALSRSVIRFRIPPSASLA